jgi:membrane protease YdiL (CAAX protease family)
LNHYQAIQNRTKFKLAGISIPYIAILVGLFVFKNAFVAISIYYVGIIIFSGITGGFRFIKSIFSGWDIRIAVLVVIMGGLSGIVVYTAWNLSALEGISLKAVFAEYGLEGIRIYVFAALAILVNPVIEEVFWRGLIGVKDKRISWLDAAFAGYHVPALLLVIKPLMATLAFITLCGAGWGLRFIKNKLDGLLVPYLAHLAGDVSLIIGIYFLVIN